VPLAVARGAPYAEAVAAMEPGETLVLYSDGLVEEPDATLDAGFGRLIEAADAAAGQADVDDFCRRLVDTVFPERGAVDDVALLAARLLPRAAAPLRLRFPARPEELSGMRRALADWLDAAGAGPADRMDVSIAASEAATNAIEHAYPDGVEGVVEVAADGTTDGRLELRVRDRGRWRAIPAPGDRGRGLPLMRAVMDEVRLDTGAEGTTVTMHRRVGGRPGRSAGPR
jgi:anti-sigma regulatory factor (Ser/Thr protein kinase)